MEFLYMILLLLIPGGIIGFVARKLLRQYEERDRRAAEKRLARQQKKELEARRAQQPKSPRQKRTLATAGGAVGAAAVAQPVQQS